MDALLLDRRDMSLAASSFLNDELGGAIAIEEECQGCCSFPDPYLEAFLEGQNTVAYGFVRSHLGSKYEAHSQVTIDSYCSCVLRVSHSRSRPLCRPFACWT